MRDSLDILESNFRCQANQRARQIRAPNALKSFAFGVLFAPGVLLGAMFVPIFGLLLALAVVMVAIIYASLKRSWLVVLCGTGGAIMIIVTLSILGASLGSVSNLILYTFLASCVASDLVALVILGGAIIAQHEAGLEPC